MKLAADLSRLGTETAFDVLARAAALQAQGKDVINLGIGQPDFATPDHIVDAGVKALRDGHHGYTPANGILPLREAVSADLHRRHGADVSPEDVQKNITIEVFTEADQLVIAYQVHRCRVSEYQALPELDADTDAVAIQQIKLAHQGCTSNHENTLL